MKTSERKKPYCDSISSNLKRILLQLNLSEEDFAESMGISCQKLSEYLEGKSLPPLEFVIDMKNIYGISADEFLTFENNSLEAISEAKNMQRYCGIYYMHYFDTTVYKYTNISDKLHPRLNYGLLQIYEDKTISGNPCFKVMALTGCSRSECTRFFSDISAESGTKKLSDIDVSKIKRFHFYNGKINVTAHNIFILLDSEFRDRCLMIFRNPDSNKEYLGGIGTANSVSRGHESMPCAQFMMLTRRTLTCDENEISEFLHLSYRKMTFSDEENLLVKRLKKIMSVNSHNGSGFSDDETDVLIVHNIEKLVNNLIRHQYFKCATISIQDDYNWYNQMDKYFDELDESSED